ncbi:MAG: hypothetical protein CL816_04920 [Coxiellaceae bacterium]|nr:hypothetical protein [Coxiellaceae bacterium]|tara:strand:- start:776 stop:1120 length:345 start_codon:yes stop_codon:yes gene_type:complete
MTLNLQSNDTQLNQTDTFEEQDQPSDQLELWFSLGISILSAFIIIFVLESRKYESNEIHPEEGSLGRQIVNISDDITEVDDEHVNTQNFNTDRFFSVISGAGTQEQPSALFQIT